MFKTSYTVAKGFHTAEQHGSRIDRVVVAEPLNSLIGKTVKMRYTYRYMYDSTPFKTEYRFDVVKKGNKAVWAHKDELKIHGATESQSYTRQITAVCAEDRIEFVINIYNL
jgi:hypothetical protein